jgi:hypothetical protein
VTKPPKNVVASVLARLRNVAQKASLSFNDILQSYVIERFLARLARSPHPDPVEAAIAEKFQAMLHLDLQNSRMKDFYDIWIPSRTLTISGPGLSQAIRSTFDRRQASAGAKLRWTVY